MGVYVVEDRSFKISFNKSQKRKDKKTVLSYEGILSLRARVSPINVETTEARNFLRMINSFVQRKRCWNFRTKLSITRKYDKTDIFQKQEGVVRLEGPLIKELFTEFPCPLEMSLVISLDHCSKADYAPKKSSMKILSGERFGLNVYNIDGGCVEQSIESFNFFPNPYSLFSPRKNQCINGRMTLELRPSTNIVLDTFRGINFLSHFDISEPDKMFTLEGSDGSVVPCDQDLLKERSKLFSSILNSSGNWNVNKNKHYKLVGFSGAAVKALVDFLMDSSNSTDVPLKNPRIALELLEMGHEFQVARLEQCMGTIFLGKPWFWFELGTASKLLMLAKYLKDCTENIRLKDAYGKMEIKAKEVMKEYNSVGYLGNPNNCTEEEKSEVRKFKTFLQNNPPLASELGINVALIF